MKWLSFINQFKIEFLLPFTGCRKVLWKNAWYFLKSNFMEVNHYTLMAVYLSRHKELDADPKAIQQAEIVGQLKTSDDAIVTNKSMFV